MAVWQSYLGVISFCSNKGIWSLSYLEGKGMFCLLCWKHDAGSKFNGHFHIRGRTNHLDRQIIWHLSVWFEFMSYCRLLVRLDKQIVWEKSSFQTAKYQTICSSKNLFVPFSHETICSSEMIWPSRRFVRPLVWKRPISQRFSILMVLFVSGIRDW